MGRAQTRPSRKRLSSVRTKSKGAGASGQTNGNDSNQYYESFPVSRSRSNSPVQNDNEIKNDAKSGVIEPAEDPGNPLGNAVDFCVDNINALHTKTMELNCVNSVEMGGVVKPCQGKSLDQLFGDLFLYNQNETQEENEGGVKSTDARDLEAQDSFERSSSKRSRNGWKKTMKISTGKNILRSMSTKRKISATEDDDNSLLWNGVADENEPEVDDIITISIESEEDTLFANLGNTATWTTIGDSPPEILEETLTSDSNEISNENTFGDEGVEAKKDDVTSDTRCEMFFSASSLLALSSCLRERTSETDPDIEKGDMVIPRDFEKEESMRSLQEDSSPPTKATSMKTKSYSASPGSSFNDVDEEEPKVEFEMILDDSRFGKRKWGKWKKLESLFGTSGNSRCSSTSTTTSSTRRGKRRRRSRSFSGKSMSSAKSVNSIVTTSCEKEDSSEMKVVLNDKVKRKRSLQSKLLGLSSRSRSTPIPKKRIPSWKKKRITSDRQESEHTTNTGDLLTTNDDEKKSSEESEVMKSPVALNEEDDLQCPASKEERKDVISSDNDSNTSSIKDISSTAVMGLQEWSWGVFNLDQKQEDDEEEDDRDVDHKSQDTRDDCDSGTDYTPQDGDTFSNHDDWIMNEDQLMSFSDDDSRKSGHSSDYASTTGSMAYTDEADTDSLIEMTTDSIIPHQSHSATQKSSKKVTKRRLALPKSIRKTFAPKKKTRSLDGFTKDVGVYPETHNDTRADSDSDSTAIEAVLEPKEQSRGTFFPSLSSSKNKAASPLEDRDDGHTTANVRDKNSSSSRNGGRIASAGGAFFMAKKFLTQQSNKKRQTTIMSSASTVDSSVTDPAPSTKDIITVVTNSNNNYHIDAATIATASAPVIRSPSRSTSIKNHQQPDYVPVDNHDDDDRDSACDESQSVFEESSVSSSSSSSSSSSASTSSRSWARDDDDAQSEGFLYGLDFLLSPEVIRE
eukprot:CAMPEP_0116144646 /NCGR_PEP_ID=MMETSP0329-20121206/16121_1 /TAXON_ID=697910 /ORGANISM="Pseudo-nitzschia arenysensis, Strain B593" /LENGTH=964 /DNA_ID=CAMNT_0003640099 /DNA_START=162 /DNA_END=3056 /DNA_ORIENTATION=-